MAAKVAFKPGRDPDRTMFTIKGIGHRAAWVGLVVWRPVMRCRVSLSIAWLSMALVLQTTASAQSGEVVLTEEFSRLSAKERSRIAREEQDNAKLDHVYQGLMSSAESLFQLERYEEALVKYQEARALRPLNVYPPVKIQDIQALIQERDRKAAVMAREVNSPVEAPRPAMPEEAPEVVSPPPPVVMATGEVPVPASVVVVPVEEPMRGSTSEGSVPPARPPREPEPAGVGPTDMVTQVLPDGVRETRYMLGSSQVIEREVVAADRRVLYKRVAHHWGAIYYFQDGQPVDERVWRARFGDR